MIKTTMRCRLMAAFTIGFTVSCAEPPPQETKPAIPASAFTYNGATAFVEASAYKELDVTFKPNGASTAKTDIVMKRLWDQHRMLAVNQDDWLVKTGSDSINGHRLIRVRFVAGPQTGQMGLILCDHCPHWAKPDEP